MSANDVTGHEALRELLARSIDEELTTLEADRLATHLRGCDECRAEEAALRRDNAWLAGTMPVALDPVVRAVVLEAARARASTARDSGWYPVTVLAASIAVFAVVVGLALRSAGPGPGAGSSAGSLPASPVVSGPPSPSPLASASPSGLGPRGTASGRLYDNDRGMTVGRIEGMVDGFREGGSGSVTFTFDDGTSWSAAITYTDYWHDPEGPWDVAFGEGCRPPVLGQTGCAPFVIQFVDGRQKADGEDEISLADGTRDAFAGRWTTWYRVDDGAVVVRLAP